MRLPNILWPVALLLVSLSGFTSGADWPMWRHDAGRSAATSMALPPDLQLQWQRQFHPPQPAYPDRVRLNFDATYQPVAAGGMVFVPSMVTDSVTALDATTGRRKWTFYADGPIRFAPVAWRGKVYCVSDDGYLYCLHAADGSLDWKFWAPPAERQPYRLLGNGRLISRWAARGGPVLKDGIIYYGCGLWPSEGVYVCAVDAKTGEQHWRSEELAHIEQGLVDHSARRDVGLTPTGYLTIAGDRLIVPAGRALPAIVSRKTGRMQPYCTGWGGRGGLARGSWWVAATGDYYMTSGELYGLTQEAKEGRGAFPPDQMTPRQFAQATGLPVQQIQRWMESGELSTVNKEGEQLVNAKTERGYLTWGSPRLEAEEYVTRKHPRLQISPANQYNMQQFRTPVFTRTDMIYSVPGGRDVGVGRRLKDLSYGSRFLGETTDKAFFSGIVADQLDAAPEHQLSVTQNAPGAPLRMWNTVRFERRWTFPADLEVFLKAASSLYAGRPGLVAGVELSGRKGPHVSWKYEIEGTPAAMLAAEKRLFVVTREGRLYCFGSGTENKTGLAATDAAPSEDLPRKNNDTTERMLEYAVEKEGICLVLDCCEPAFLRELCRRSDLDVIALDTDAKAVRSARRHLDQNGLYGTRVHIVSGDLSTVRPPCYMASVVISTKNNACGAGSIRQLVSRVSDLLHPREGTAYLSLSALSDKSLARLKEVKPSQIRMEESETEILLERAGISRDAASWTHEAGGPENAFSNADESVKPPFGILWFGGAIDCLWPNWDYTHSRPPRPLVCDGRMFFVIGNTVHAVDVYTGRPLWTDTLERSHKLEQLRQEHFVARRGTADHYIATPDTLYIVCRSCCLLLDAETGAKTGKITTPASLINGESQSKEWHEARVWQDCLLVAMGHLLFCMDRHDGTLRWKVSTDKDQVTFAVGEGRVYGADYWSSDRRRRGEEKRTETLVQAIDVETGAVLWKTTARRPEESVNAPKAGWLKDRIPPLPPYISYCEEQDVVLLSATYSVAAACQASDGKMLWQRKDAIPISRARPPVVLADRFVSRTGSVYNMLTGEPLGGKLWSSLRACNRALGNRRYVFVRDGVPMACDLRTGEQRRFLATRSGCTNNLIPAEGVLAAPNFAVGCACNYPVLTSFAAVHVPEAGKWRKAARAQ